MFMLYVEYQKDKDKTYFYETDIYQSLETS